MTGLLHKCILCGELTCGNPLHDCEHSGGEWREDLLVADHAHPDRIGKHISGWVCRTCVAIEASR